jgi:myo-inositol-1(or 4)-monophosphatase
MFGTFAGRLDARELKSLKDFAESLASEIAEIQRQHLGRPNPVRYKGAIDLVTRVDHLCEETIIRRISDRFPEHHIVSEETEHRGTGSGFQWYVDPLDGTTNYVHGYPCFGVSLGLEVEKEMVLGVVCDPMRGEFFYGVKDGGAFVNDRKINVSRTQDLDHSLLATGFPYDIRESQETNIDHFARFSLVCQGVRRDGSAALDLCYVAMGRFDGFWEIRLHPWDMAAGTLIVREAGGRISDLRGGSFRIDSKEVLATNGWIHDQMVSVLNEGRIERGRW